MGRRQKEPPSAHRGHIAAATEFLFDTKGMKAVTMDDIASEAGYSKATLYVYFQNKEEIICFLVLNSMKKLKEYLCAATASCEGVKEKYQAICGALVHYQEESPFYFELALGEIKADPEKLDCTPVQREIYEVGEEINAVMAAFLSEGIASGELRDDFSVLPTVFLFWASLSGFILMAAKKQNYFEKELCMTNRQFLQEGFDTLFRCIEKRRETCGE